MTARPGPIWHYRHDWRHDQEILRVELLSCKITTLVADRTSLPRKPAPLVVSLIFILAKRLNIYQASLPNIFAKRVLKCLLPTKTSTKSYSIEHVSASKPLT